MARSPFAGGDLGRNTSGAPIGGAVGVQGGAGAALARSTRALAGQIQDMADRAEGRAGLAEAARDSEAGTLQVRGGHSVRDRAYDQAAREQLSASRRAAWLTSLSEIETANPDNLAEFATATAAARQAFRPTGDPALDLDFDQFVTMQSAAAQGRVRARAEQRRVDIGRAALVEDLAVEARAFGQMVAGADFDDAGAAQVALGFGRFAERLARYGPREGFSIGGVEFGPDPDRLEVADAAELARMALQAQGEARSSWILNAAQRLPNAAAKATFAQEVRQRWASGDPAFAGLDASQMDALNARLTSEADRAGSDERAARAEQGARARNLIEALRYGGAIDAEELRAAAQASGDPGLVAQADWALTVGMTPPGTARDLDFNGDPAAGVGFAGALNLLLELEGSAFVAEDNGAGRAQFGITERSHPEAWRDGRVTREEAAAIYRRDYWDAIGGDSLPPALAIAALATAAVAGPGVARQFIRESGGDVGVFLQLEEARFRRLAEQDPARYGDDLQGWLNRQRRVRAAAARVQSFANTREGMASDPLAYALGTENRPALASVPDLDTNGWQTPEGSRAWGEALRRRRALGQQLAEDYGVAPRILTNGEAAYYREAIDADPAVAIGLARRARAALDEAGARDLLREIGGDGPAPVVALHIADLEVGGQRSFAAMAIRGLELRQDGARQRDYERDEETLDQAVQRWAPALANQPNVLAAARQVAELARLTDSAQGVVRPSSFYLNSALGGSQRDGRTFGGLAVVNGRATVLPRWLAADAADDALSELAESWGRTDRGPVYSNGDPVNRRDLRRARLVLLENGHYGLVNPRTDAVMLGRTGRPYELDFEANRDFLARRLPGAVRPR